MLEETDINEARKGVRRLDEKEIRARFSIKNLKFAEFASEETLCFKCSIYFDGKRIAVAKNDGQGGMTFIHPVKPFDKNREILKEAESLATMLPSITSTYGGNMAITINYDLEMLISDMVNDKLVQRDRKRHVSKMKRWCKTKTVFRTKEHLSGNEEDDQLWLGDMLVSNSSYTPEAKEHFLGKYPDAEFLNDVIDTW